MLFISLITTQTIVNFLKWFYLFFINSKNIFISILATILKTSFHQESVDLLKGYKKAIDVIGEPISVKSIDKTDPFNITDKNLTQVFNI